MSYDRTGQFKDTVCRSELLAASLQLRSQTLVNVSADYLHLES